MSPGNPTAKERSTMLVLFSEVPVGGRFEFRGRRYEKLALSLARDEERCGNVFMDRTEVCVENATALRAAGAAPAPERRASASAHATPPPRSWTDYLSVAPGQSPGSRRTP